MKKFHVGQVCAMKSKDGNIVKGTVYSEKTMKRNKKIHVQVEVNDDILLFPLDRTLFLVN